jgi:hypothetical protein
MTSCCETKDKEAEAKIYDLLGTAGLRDIVEQANNANRVMAESFRHLGKADRAVALGYGPEVIAIHQSAGERANRRSRRQFASVIEAIDERLSRDDWPDRVANSRHEYEVHQGREQLEDARADFRAALLDLDTLPSTATSRVVTLMNEALDRVASDGLSGAVQLLREQADYAVTALAAPEMGRQPASPDTAMYVACTVGVYAICAIAMAICLASYFCWCCWFWAILLAAAAGILSCVPLYNL